MPTPKPLRIRSAFGSSLGHAMLLAAHPDETHDANGDHRPDARTFVLELKGQRCVVREELPVQLVRTGWSVSPRPGTP